MILDNLVNKSYENLLEAQNCIHELEMKMIKCEHYCLVNEDSNLLLEAENDFKEKVKSTIKNMVSKFLEFIEEVRIKWTSFMSNIAKKFLNQTIYEVMLEVIKDEEITLEIDRSELDNISGIFLDIVSLRFESLNDDEKFNKTLHLIENGEISKVGKVRITKEYIEDADAFLHSIPDYIGQLNKIKAKVKELAANDIKNESNSNNLVTSKYIHLINKLIIRINKASITAIKICRACYHKTTNKEGVKNIKEVYKTAKRKGYVK